jgi:hypothetical protein
METRKAVVKITGSIKERKMSTSLIFFERRIAMKGIGYLLSGIIGGIIATIWNLIVLLVGAVIGFKLGEHSCIKECCDQLKNERGSNCRE